ncbi:MAG: ferredoxin reductase family protein [Patescibacteria group bacterium]|jgi:predicted ferric reductase
MFKNALPIKILFFAFFSANIVIIFFGWFTYSGALLNGPSLDVILALGRITGLLAVYGIMWQLLLIGRIKLLERILSFDKGLSLHHWLGIGTLIFIVAHPILVTLAYAEKNQVTLWHQIISFFSYWEDVNVAIISIGLFIFATIISLHVIKKKLNYEFWYAAHLSFYLAIFLAFGHQLSTGGDFLFQPWFRVYWALLYIAMIGTFVFSRFIQPLLLWKRHRFVVESITQESTNIHSITIVGKNMNTFTFSAGQFAIMRFFTKSLFAEAHPFSFSAHQNHKYLRITFKELGDFTKRLLLAKPGTMVLIDGPHGGMTSETSTHENIILIAGGIGVTPLLTLAETFSKQGKNINFFYSAKEEKDFIFQKEISSLNNTRLHTFCSSKQERLTINTIIESATSWKESDIYICGPSNFSTQFIKNFKKLGLKSSQLHAEKFSF